MPGSKYLAQRCGNGVGLAAEVIAIAEASQRELFKTFYRIQRKEIEGVPATGWDFTSQSRFWR